MIIAKDGLGNRGERGSLSTIVSGQDSKAIKNIIN